MLSVGSYGCFSALLLMAFSAACMTAVDGGCVDPVWVPYSSSLNLTDYVKMPNTAKGLPVCSALNAQGIAVPGYVNSTGGTPMCYARSVSFPTFSSTNFKVLLKAALMPGPAEDILASIMNSFLPANEIMGSNECAVTADGGNETAVSAAVGKIYVACPPSAPGVRSGGYEPGRGFVSASNATLFFSLSMQVVMLREPTTATSPNSTLSRAYSCFSNASPVGSAIGQYMGAKDRLECVIRCRWNSVCKQFVEEPMTTPDGLFAGFKCSFYSTLYVANMSQSTVCVLHL